jgi:hypothetical protein
MILGSAPVTSATLSFLTAINDGRVFAKLNSIPTPYLNGGPCFLGISLSCRMISGHMICLRHIGEKLLDAKPGVRVSARLDVAVPFCFFDLFDFCSFSLAPRD